MNIFLLKSESIKILYLQNLGFRILILKEKLIFFPVTSDDDSEISGPGPHERW